MPEGTKPYIGFRPTGDRRFAPAGNGRMLTPIACITDEDDGGFHWTENLVMVLARYIIGLVTSTRGTARHGGVASLLCSRGNAVPLYCCAKG
jgi:hypothetical protein